MKTSGVANAIWVGISSPMNESLKLVTSPRPSCLMKETQPCSAFHKMTGEKTINAVSPPRYSHGESSHRLSLGTLISQIRIAGPKNIAVYFDASAAPAAAPTASHHAPRPLSSTLARKNSTKLEATRSGESGVTIREPTAPPTSRSKTRAATVNIVLRTSRVALSFGVMEGSSLAPDEQSGHRVIPDHAHQRTSRT